MILKMIKLTDKQSICVMTDDDGENKFYLPTDEGIDFPKVFPNATIVQDTANDHQRIYLEKRLNAFKGYSSDLVESGDTATLRTELYNLLQNAGTTENNYRIATFMSMQDMREKLIQTDFRKPVVVFTIHLDTLRGKLSGIAADIAFHAGVINIPRTEEDFIKFGPYLRYAECYTTTDESKVLDWISQLLEQDGVFLIR